MGAGHHPQMRPEPNEEGWWGETGETQQTRVCEISNAAAEKETTGAQLVPKQKKENSINIHDPVPPFQIRQPPSVPLHPNPPSSSLPLPSIGWQHLVGHMVRQLLQGNMGICGATQRKGGDNTGDVGVFVRGCRWHRGRVIVIFISSIFSFSFFYFSISLCIHLYVYVFRAFGWFNCASVF